MFERDHKRRELPYQVKLEHFEGPMDLLLHLIRRDKINIYDIPIAHITREYLSYIEIMKELELEVAGEFFVMAATLMRIKVQMLLPRRVVEEEEEDPREELVRNLIEYKKFKKAADHLAGKESSRRDVFVRPVPEYIEEKNTIPKMELSLFDLMYAFKTILKDLRKKITYRVEIESHSVDEKIDFIKERINNNSEILFTELIKEADSKIEIIAIFLAILELIRGGFIIARQMLGGNDIWIYRREDIKVVERQEY